jgi:hypothetical protein
MARALEAAGRVQFLTAAEMARDYPVAAYDEHGLRDEYLAALGTAISRRAYAARSPRRRILALYCDGVLWDGICAETPPEELVVREGHRAVQSFALELRARGWEIWLVGRGDEEDARRAFERRTDMPLAWGDFAAVRLNWASSAANLCALMAERDGRPSEIVFLAHRPASAQLVRDHCPSVLSLTLPRRQGAIARFLTNAWAFDDSPLRDEPERPPRCRGPVEVAGVLAPGVDVRPATDADFDAVARLSGEVHHFNATDSRVTASELAWFASQRGREVLVIRSWAEGDVVGALRTRRLGRAMRIVDWWLRAGKLGRGLEVEALRAVGRRAVAAGVDAVEVAHVARRCNEPVRRFLEGLGARPRDGEYVMSLAVALSAARALQAPRGEARGEVALVHRAAGAMSSPRNVLRVLRRRAPAPIDRAMQDSSGPRTEEERWLAGLWTELLGAESIRVSDDFFALGGDSLSGARAVARVRAAFGVELPLTHIFDEPTLEAQARCIAAARTESGPVPAGAPTHVHAADAGVE